MSEVDALYEEADALLYDYLDAMYQTWESMASSFNPGQETIYVGHILEALDDHAEDAADDWPWGHAENYFYNVIDCFEEEVMLRAFDQSIMEPVPEMQEIILLARWLYMVAEIIEAFEGGG